MSIAEGLPVDLAEHQALLIRTATVAGELLAEKAVGCRVSLTIKDGSLEPKQQIRLSRLDREAGSLYEYGIQLRDPNSEELRIAEDRAVFECYRETTLDDGVAYSRVKETLELTPAGDYRIVTDNRIDPRENQPATLRAASAMLDDFCSRAAPLSTVPQLAVRHFPSQRGLWVPASGLVPVMGRVLGMVAGALQSESRGQFDARIEFGINASGEFRDGDQIIDFSTRNADESHQSHFGLEVGRYNSWGFRSPRGQYVDLWCSFRETRDGVSEGGYLMAAPEGDAFIFKQMDPEESIERGANMAGHIIALANRIISPLTK